MKYTYLFVYIHISTPEYLIKIKIYEIVHEEEMDAAREQDYVTGDPIPQKFLERMTRQFIACGGILFLSGSGSKGCWNHEEWKMEIHMEEKSPFLASCVEWGASSLIELGPLCLFRGAIYSLANSVWFGLVG